MSEDVLERADKYTNKPGTWTLDGGNTDALIKDLAAEVRALRKDRERLDLIESLADDGRYGWSHAGRHRFVVPHLVHRSQSPEFNTFRESIDAAMSARGGEGGA